jgi:L-ornithine N5-oxygenase
MQRIRNESSSTPPQAQILTNRIVTSASAGKDGLELVVKNSSSEKLADGKDGEEEVMNVDYVFAATGYRRDAHVRMLEGCEELKPKGEEGWRVARDYRVLLREGAVQRGAGIWLQGCNEGTHGVSTFFPFFFLFTLFLFLQTSYENTDQNHSYPIPSSRFYPSEAASW